MPLIDLFKRLDKDQQDFLRSHAPRDLVGHEPVHWPENVFVDVLCDEMRIPTYQVTADNVDLDAFMELENLCVRFRFLPLFREGSLMVVACLEPWNKTFVSNLRKVLFLEIRSVGVVEAVMDDALATLSSRASRKRAIPPQEIIRGLQPPLYSWPLQLDDPNWGMKVVESIINEAHKEGAADIHWEPAEGSLQIRFRINSDLNPMPPIEEAYRDAVLESVKIKAGIPVQETNRIQRGRISLVTSIGKLDLRVESLPTQWGSKVVTRLLDPRTIARFYGRLPFKGKQLEIVQRAIASYKGIILVTGPTGSGKTTSLLGIITSMDLATLNISTIEDPVEYALRRVTQTDVSRSLSGEGSLSFASVLRSLLRQDPDVILVGEIRDLETMNIAIEGALTGHLLFSTLHTNNCAETIDRILQMKQGGNHIEPAPMAGALTCVIAQRLVEELCEKCREPVPTPPSARRWYKYYEMEAPDQVYIRRGCSCCRQGVKGRVPVFEIMEITEKLRDHIKSDFDAKKFEEVWRSEGGRTLAQYGLDLVSEGRVDYRDIRSLIWNESALDSGKGV